MTNEEIREVLRKKLDDRTAKARKMAAAAGEIATIAMQFTEGRPSGNLDFTDCKTVLSMAEKIIYGS